MAATGTSLLGLHGIGPSGAARLLVEVGDITRFPTKGHFASWAGTAPVDASSGDNVHQRLFRGGNRHINQVLHIMATVQLRTRTTEGRAYYDRKVAAGKTPNAAMRCRKRRLSVIVYRTMLNRHHHRCWDGPGRTPGRVTVIQRGRLTAPHRDTSDQSLPGPVTHQHRTPLMTPA
ncbi:transposase [Ornithinimicrobium cerasi]|uniref:transposase n=1 Tax=Ornithinimicrobium cerasi TaxID=2248773 RepID=UPI001F0256C6|nr:transposase [Ornithinimicrobium cerasi]